jgi:PAS domain S-box-containing protein
MLLDEKCFFDCNNATLLIFGFSSKEEFTKVHPGQISPPYQPDGVDSLTAANKKIAQALKNGTSSFEWIHRRQNGEEFSADVLLTAFNFKGKRVLQATVRDITERKIAEENIKKSLNEKEVLLREIHHRVKNNMQIISSLLNLQMGYIKDKNITDIFSESQNRILSMALVHEKLYQSSDLRMIDFKGYINDLGANLLQSYNANYIKLNVNVEDISLDIDLAIPIGLIINELITNSLKYAFPDGMKGEITISISSINENMLKLVVSDNGIGLPKDLDVRNTKTLGLHLVTLLAENQLKGKIDINREKGTEFQIKFKGKI